MRFVIARVNHETNTFSPLPTPLESFRPHWGADALKVARTSGTAMSAFVSYAESVGAEMVTPVFGTAYPSGPVADDAYEKLCGAIVEAVKGGCDAVLLDLHGAMVTQSLEDGEGVLLERLRAILGKVPIGVALDLHANVTERMVEAADVIVGFKTYPHIDMVETGQHVVKLIDRMLKGGKAPAMTWSHPPILAQTLRMNTGEPGAMQATIAAARAAERREGVQAVSVFGGFPIADITDAGMSVVTVADTTELAQSVTDEIAARIWTRREDFIYHEEPLQDSIKAAAALPPGKGPVLLLDHGDNCMSGGTCDTMDVLTEALEQGLGDIVVGPICDPQAVAEMFAAGTGKTITVEVGNRYALPGIGVSKKPLPLTGTIKTLSDGRYVITGPTYTGMASGMGRAAVLDTGRALVLVSEEPHEPWDKGVFTCAGIDPLACRFLILKSRMYCRPVFQPAARAPFQCARLGVNCPNFRLLNFKKVKRPVYPLDPTFRWPESPPSQ